MQRRHFLTGTSGVVMALPLLEGLLPKEAQADPSTAQAPYAVFYRKPTGVAQKGRQLLRGCPERFWPDLPPDTKLDASNCPDPSQRGSGEFTSQFWSRATLMQGLAHPFIDWGHMDGVVQMFTGARPDPIVIKGNPHDAFIVRGESLDNRIARELGGANASLALGVQPWCSQNNGSRLLTKNNEGSCIDNESTTNFRDRFDTLFAGVNTDPAAFERLRARKQSVNDLLRGRLKKLSDHKRLSKSDRERLDLHASNIRDLEKLVCDPTQGGLRGDAGAFQDEANVSGGNEQGAFKMRLRGSDIAARLTALAVSCGVTRAVVINGGSHNTADMFHYDDEWPAEWAGIADFHEGVSHANLSEQRFFTAHQCADRSQIRQFRNVLRRLDEYKLGSGTLLDAGVCLFASDIGQGCHTLSDVPYIYVGSAGGRLKTGLFLDLFKGTPQESQQMSNDRGEPQRSDLAKRAKYFEAPVRLLNTLGAAVGLKSGRDNTKPLDDHNHDNNGGITGRLSQLIAD